ncbi:MAG: multicopper oxidase domain-containing protein [Acidobacteriota bacterium]
MKFVPFLIRPVALAALALVLPPGPSLAAGGGHGNHGGQPVECEPRQGFPEPCRIAVEEGQDAAQIFVQFDEEEVMQTDASGQAQPVNIWTRSYGLAEGQGMIPGPSFFFSPGDLLQITLTNLLNPELFLELKEYENNVNPGFDTDEIIEHVGHEVNVPHNPNNTNLHTHGLHVDPSVDDVTLIILPEGQTKEGCPDYSHEACNDREQLTDAATLECCTAGPGYDPSLWPYIREGSWPYQYRIPDSHLPGTHWYHAHKHGSTSVHVENGMAGALIIQPENRQDRILPELPDSSDRVMVIQEISNYGLNKGKGGGQGKEPTTAADIDSAGASATADSKGGSQGPSPTLKTVNGEVMPTLTLAAGQAERWRLINAAANHGSFSYLWLGREVSPRRVDGKKPVTGTSYYEQVPMKLIAVDGITFEKAVEITAESPLFMGPGNRADVLVQLDQEGGYALIKNMPSDVQIVSPSRRSGRSAGRYVSVEVAIDKDQISNPYLQVQTLSGTPNFNNDRHCWKYAAPLSINLESAPTKAISESMIGASMVPILRVSESEARDGSQLLDVDFDTRLDAGDQGWRPIAVNDLGGGAIDTAILFKIEVSAGEVKGYSLPPDAALNARLKKLSPTGNPNAAPVVGAKRVTSKSSGTIDKSSNSSMPMVDWPK